MANTVYGDVGTEQVGYGLTQAQDWLKDSQSFDTPYPEYTQRTGPVEMDYGVGYAQNANPYEKVGGIATDWAGFQDQMRQPVHDAYEQNLRDIDSRFSNSGMFGSRGYGMNDDTLVKAGQGLATGLLGADVAAQDQYLKNAEFQSNQNLNAWKTGLTEAERQSAHDKQQFAWDYGQQQQAVDFANSEQGRQDAYNYDKFGWDYQQHRQPFSDALSLASGSASTANQASANQAAIDAANINANAAGTSAWGSAIGGIAGGLLGGNTGSNIFSGVGNLFDGNSATGFWDAF